MRVRMKACVCLCVRGEEMWACLADACVRGQSGLLSWEQCSVPECFRYLLSLLSKWNRTGSVYQSEFVYAESQCAKQTDPDRILNFASSEESYIYMIYQNPCDHLCVLLIRYLLLFSWLHLALRSIVFMSLNPHTAIPLLVPGFLFPW